jgi:hypothetical protein
LLRAAGKPSAGVGFNDGDEPDVTLRRKGG